MSVERIEVAWVDARSDYSIDELLALSGLPRDVLATLADCGVLPCRAADAFEPESVALAQAARRLHDAFDLEAEALAVAVALLGRVRALERELDALRERTR